MEIRAKLPSTPSQISENTRKIGAQIELEVRYTKMPKIKPKKVKEFGVTPILESGFVTEEEIFNQSLTIPSTFAPP